MNIKTKIIGASIVALAFSVSVDVCLAGIKFIANAGDGIKIKSANCPSGSVLINGRCTFQSCDGTAYPYTTPYSDEESISPTCADVQICIHKFQ